VENADLQHQVKLGAGDRATSLILLRSEVRYHRRPRSLAALNGLFAAKEVFSAKAGIDVDEPFEAAPTPEMTENPVAITDVRQTGDSRHLRGRCLI
jgi:hypothetical protein